MTTSELFSISSFCLDYSVGMLVERMKAGLFYMPGSQHQFAWSQNQASRFIESLLLGLPVPEIYLFEESETDKYLVVDGQQCLKSLEFFYTGQFNDTEFRLGGLNSEWDGETYETLSDDDQAQLGDAVIRGTVFRQDLNVDQMNSVYEVFERTNTREIKLASQEIRSCIYHGNFNNFLHQLNNNPAWRTIYGPKSKRLKDVEAILRFLAFFESSGEYASPMKHFLNVYMAKKRNDSDEQLQRLAEVFSATMAFVVSSLGDRPFRPDGALNVAVFDAVATSIAHMHCGESPLSEENTKKAYLELLVNEEFRNGYLRSTADVENVKKRFGEANAALGVE